MLGDRVQFPLALQRLVKSDLLSIQSLLTDTLVRSIAGVLGRAWGAASYIDYDTSAFSVDPVPASGVVNIGHGLLVGVMGYDDPSPTADITPYGGVYVHDPDRPAQAGSSSVSLTGGVHRFILFRRTERTDQGIASRVWLNVATGALEIDPSTPTEVHEVIEFTASATITTGLITDDWFPMATVSWDAGVPTITSIPFIEGPTHVLDGGFVSPPPSDATGVGLVSQLQALWSQMRAVLSSDDPGGVVVPMAPTRGLAEINAILDTGVGARAQVLGAGAGLSTYYFVADGILSMTGSYVGNIITDVTAGYPGGPLVGPDVLNVLVATQAQLDAHSAITYPASGDGYAVLRILFPATVQRLVRSVQLTTRSSLAIPGYIASHYGTERFAAGVVSTFNEVWVHVQVLDFAGAPVNTEVSFSIFSI